MTVSEFDTAPSQPSGGSPVTRRAALAAGGLSVAAVAAACGGSDTSTTTTTNAGGAAAGAGTGASSGAGTGASSGAGTGASSGGNAIAQVSDIPDGGSLVVGEVLLARTGEKVVAHTVVCTHQQCPVTAAGAEADCKCHGSKFNASTGAVINGPATEPLAEIAVTVKDGSVLQS